MGREEAKHWLKSTVSCCICLLCTPNSRRFWCCSAQPCSWSTDRGRFWRRRAGIHEKLQFFPRLKLKFRRSREEIGKRISHYRLSLWTFDKPSERWHHFPSRNRQFLWFPSASHRRLGLWYQACNSIEEKKQNIQGQRQHKFPIVSKAWRWENLDKSQLMSIEEHNQAALWKFNSFSSLID
jgi:hypothetical protein